MANRDKLINLAQKAMSRGQWEKAVGLLERVLSEDPSDVRSLLKLGDVHAKKGDRSRAAKVYRQVAEHHADQGFFLKSVAIYKQILKLDPADGDAALRIAELHEQLGLTQDAVVHFQLSLPVLEAQGRHEQSLAVLERLVELDGENVAMRIKLAETLSRLERREKAVVHFAAAAVVLKQQARIEDYVKVAERLVFHDPRRFEVVKDLAKLYLSRGDTKRGLAKLQICFRDTPRDVETLSLLAKAFADLGQVQKTVFVYRELARVHQEEGRPSEAREIHRLILQHHPDDPDALRALDLEAGPSAAAEQHAALSTASFGFPQSAGQTGALPIDASQDLREPTLVPPVEVRFPTADILPASLHAEPTSEPVLSPSLRPRPRAPSLQGELVIESASSADPHHRSEQVDHIVREADVYIRYSLPGKAIEHLDRALRLDPRSVVAYRRLHQVYESMGDVDRAAEALANVMLLHTERGQHDRASEARERLFQLRPDHPALQGGPARAAGSFVRDAARSETTADDDEFEPDEFEPDDDEELVLDTDELVVESPRPPRGLPLSAFAQMAIERPPVADPDAAAAMGSHAGSRDPDLDDEELISAIAYEVDAEQLEAEQLAPEFLESLPEDPSIPQPPATPPPVPQDGSEVPWFPISSFDEPSEAPPQEPVVEPLAEDELELADVVAALEAGTADLARSLEFPPIDDEREEIEFFLEQGLLEEAKDALAELESRHPEHPEVAALSARVAASGGEAPADPVLPAPSASFEETERALSFLGADTVSEIGPGGDEHYDQGMAYKQIGQLEEAAEAFRRSAEIAPERAAAALEMLGHCLAESRRFEEAANAFRQALERCSPGEAAVNLRYELGDALERMGDFAEARTWFEACADAQPAHRDVQMRLRALRRSDFHEPPEPEPSEIGSALPQKRSKISYI